MYPLKALSNLAPEWHKIREHHPANVLYSPASLVLLIPLSSIFLSYDLDQVGHAAVVHVSDALIESRVDLPVVLQGV